MRTKIGLIMTAVSAVVAAPVDANPPAPTYDVAAIKTVPADQVPLGHQRFAALAQYHRWYLYYENIGATEANAVDILDENVTIESGLGKAAGHAAYRDRLSKLPRTWKNAHDVKSTAVTVNADGTISLTANVVYLNQGMLPNGVVRTADLTYKTRLRPSETVLPKFTAIEIGQNATGETTDFIPKYADNRVRSLVYYWYALIDNPKRNAEPFREILADDFALTLSVGKLDSFDKFKAWYSGPVSSVKVSAHQLNSLTFEETAPNTYKVVVDADWQGILQDGRMMVGRTLTNWTLIDDPARRFAQIKSYDVKILVPFQPKP
jgi:hypothetical protein